MTTWQASLWLGLPPNPSSVAFSFSVFSFRFSIPLFMLERQLTHTPALQENAIVAPLSSATCTICEPAGTSTTFPSDLNVTFGIWITLIIQRTLSVVSRLALLGKIALQ